MKQKIQDILMALLLACGLVAGISYIAGPAFAQSGTPGNATFFHSNSLAATATAQRVQTTRMRSGRCHSWFFENRSATETIYINVNSEQGYNGDAVATDENMVVIQPSATFEFEDTSIQRFSVIATGSAELYWLCGCKG